MSIENERNLLSLRDKYKGKRCFVIGNGPSTKKQNLKKLYNEHVFLCNWFVLKDEWEYLNKANLCISDAHLWNYGEGLHEELLLGILKNKKANFFFEETAKGSISKEELLNEMKIFYLKCNRKLKLYEGEFEANITKNLAWGLTVILEFNIFLAYYMGFKDVYLLGCDCDYKLDESKDFDKSFCYDIKKIPEKDLNYIKEHRDVHQAHEKLDTWLKGYKTMRNIFEKENRNLYNAGIAGKVDVLKRVDYNSLFKG